MQKGIVLSQADNNKIIAEHFKSKKIKSSLLATAL